MFDSLILFVASYGYILVALLCSLKLYLLLWYKPGNIGFAFNNFLFLSTRVSRSTREMDNPKFPYFKKAYTQISIAIYLFLIIWVLLFALVGANAR